MYCLSNVEKTYWLFDYLDQVLQDQGWELMGQVTVGFAPPSQGSYAIKKKIKWSLQFACW